jgi:hypothetical protein
MGSRRIHFAEDDEPIRPKASVWVTRCVIAGLLVGCGGAAHILLGLRLF